MFSSVYIFSMFSSVYIFFMCSSVCYSMFSSVLFTLCFHLCLIMPLYYASVFSFRVFSCWMNIGLVFCIWTQARQRRTYPSYTHLYLCASHTLILPMVGASHIIYTPTLTYICVRHILILPMVGASHKICNI